MICAARQVCFHFFTGLVSFNALDAPGAYKCAGCDLLLTLRLMPLEHDLPPFAGAPPRLRRRQNNGGSGAGLNLEQGVLPFAEAPQRLRRGQCNESGLATELNLDAEEAEIMTERPGEPARLRRGAAQETPASSLDNLAARSPARLRRRADHETPNASVDWSNVKNISSTSSSIHASLEGDIMHPMDLVDDCS